MPENDPFTAALNQPSPPARPDEPPAAAPKPAPTPAQLSSHTFALLMSQTFGPEHPLHADYQAVAADVAARFDPQDPAEEMLVAQMLWTHARVLFLTRLAHVQKHTRWFALYSAECDKAMDLFRRQMLALADYRRSRRSNFTAIRQANIAAQQVVQSPRPRKPTVRPAPAHFHAPALPTKAKKKAKVPPHPGRPSRPASGGPHDPPLDAQHRPPHPRGKGPLQPKRPDPRPLLPHHP